MNCRQFIDRLDDYLAQAQAPDDRQIADDHLAICPYCRDYLKTYQGTIDLVRQAAAAAPETPVPEALSRALADLLRRPAK